MRDLAGQTFNLWTVLERTPAPKRPDLWRCRCQCGTEGTVRGHALIVGGSRSCGCERRLVGQLRRAHPSTYTSWDSMHKRTAYLPLGQYPNYDRRIGICSRWDSFPAFLEDMGPRPAGKTLDRYPDPTGDYVPGNCRWATPTEQNLNRQTKALTYTFAGETRTAEEWASTIGITDGAMRSRLARWPLEKALTLPRKEQAGG